MRYRSKGCEITIQIIKDDMKTATIKWSTFMLAICFLFGSSMTTQAQTNPDLGEEFIFFIDGLNVLIPTSDGFTVNDPLDPTSGNKVYEIIYGDWTEAGFRWPTGGESGTVGANMLGFTGENYGDTDTLYVKLLADSSTRGKDEFIAFLDTETGNVVGTDDLPFRMRWTIPEWAKNNEWHELAIPLPPQTSSALDSAKAGKNLDGSDLAVEVDTLFNYWAYAGAWGNGVGVWDNTDPNWQEFDWQSVKYAGRMADHNAGGGSIFFDYFAIGVTPENLVDSPPSAPATVDGSNAEGVNTVTWTAVAGAAGYNVYFSESPITDVLASGVQLIGSGDDAATSFDHTIVAPHISLAENYTANYAVTAKSPFGAESAPGTGNVTGTVSVLPNYAYELSEANVGAALDAILDGTIPDAATLASFFPDGYAPFEVNEARKQIENGDGGSGDDDISGKWWIGYGAEFDELIIYHEITDDVLSFNAAAGDRTAGGSTAWDDDSIEMALGNYSPASFVIGSTLQDMVGGDTPNYQFRIGNFSDDAPFTFVSQRFNAEIPNSQTIYEETATGYRLLTLINTDELAGGDSADVAFDFPASNEIKTYPFNIGLNDADETGSRETQITWSDNAGGDGWWNTPAKWQVIAFVGSNMATSTDEETFENPYTFSLDQNYPNPFNPTTNISFTLEGATEVTLEVFNLLGQKVATLANRENLNAGSHTMTFNAANLSSGVYFYRISTASSFVQTRKMMLIK